MVIYYVYLRKGVGVKICDILYICVNVCCIILENVKCVILILLLFCIFFFEKCILYVVYKL